VKRLLFQRLKHFRQGLDLSDLALKVAERNVLMLCVRRGHTFSWDDHFVVSLVCIDGSHPHTGMGINATKNEMRHLEADEQVFQGSPEKCAVSFLNNFMIRGQPLKLWQELTPHG